MSNSGNLALVEEFFFMLSVQEESNLEPVHLVASVDLAEFSLTEEELQKLHRLARRLELALLDAFTQHWEAASVIVEIRPNN